MISRTSDELLPESTLHGENKNDDAQSKRYRIFLFLTSYGFQIKIDPVNPTDRSDFENMTSDMSLNPLRQKL